MACISAEGQVTDSARKMLAVLDQPATAEIVAERTSLPLFRVRGGLREMAEAELVAASDGVYVVTERGRSILSTSQ